LFIWVRTIKVFSVFQGVGAFVYMLSMIFIDVVRWLLLYAIALVACACAIFVLYRNQHMASGGMYRIREPYDHDVDEECDKFDILLGSLEGTFAMLLEVVLDGGGYWHCFSNSNFHYTGPVLFGIYLLFVVIILVNVLVAMLSDTFSKVQNEAFMNYAHEFAKILIRFRSASFIPQPLNLFSLPCKVVQSITFVVQGARSLFIVLFARKAIDKTPEFLAQMLGLVLPQAPDSPVIDVINQIRNDLIGSSTRIKHFQGAIARFCRAQDDSVDPPSQEEIREIVRETVQTEQERERVELVELMLEQMGKKMQAVVREELKAKR